MSGLYHVVQSPNPQNQTFWSFYKTRLHAETIKGLPGVTLLTNSMQVWSHVSTLSNKDPIIVWEIPGRVTKISQILYYTMALHKTVQHIFERHTNKVLY